jgi:hypothetical protein
MLKNKNIKRNIDEVFSKLEDAKWHTDHSTAESRHKKMWEKGNMIIEYPME